MPCPSACGDYPSYGLEISKSLTKTWSANRSGRDLRAFGEPDVVT